MKLSELTQRLQDYQAIHGDMNFAVEVLDERHSTDPDDSVMGDHFQEISHDKDERGKYGRLEMRRKRDS